jgi:high-affinity iron transporter
MLRIAIIVFRESIEMAILLSILIALTKKILNSRLYLIAGIVLGVFGASLFAFFASTLSVSLSGVGDEVFDFVAIMLSVFMISFTVAWIQNCTSGFRKELDKLSSNSCPTGLNKFVLTSVAATVVFREGIEIMIYLYGISSLDSVDMDDYLWGFVLGTMSAVVLGLILYWGLIKLPGKYIFKASSWLLILIAAGLSAHAAGILTSSGLVEYFNDELWDTSWLIEDQSNAGRVLESFVGYTAKPNGMQVIFYCTTLLFIFILGKIRTVFSKRTQD